MTSFTPRILPAFAFLAVFLLASLPARAIIDPALQMQLGNPSGATADPNNHDHYLIQRSVEAIDFSDNLGEPNWASWDLTAADIGSSGRSDSFITDNTLPADFYHVTSDDYSGSGFDRGHMCPSADRTDNTTDNKLVFYMSNIIPQASQNNEGVWNNFEDYCRSLAQSGDELLITCGPSDFTGARISPSAKASIPSYTWKIAVVVPPGEGTALSRIDETTRVIALKIPNNNSVSSAWQNYITSANEIQIDTGLTFFTALPADVAAVLRAEVDGQSGPPPGIDSFDPGSGEAGDSVVITGTNFTGATEVTFAGVNASFNIDSPTQITAAVPVGATTGQLSVTTPAGTGLSDGTFSVNGVMGPDLVVNSTHAGVFTQGDAGDTYTLTVENIGELESVGAVMVSNALPAGLVATSMAGTGWTFDLNSLTATRSDNLQANNSFPPIILTVSVDPAAPASVTNFVYVSGGGDTDLTDDSDSDITAINPTGAIDSTNLLAWDVSAQLNFGPSPFVPTTQNAGLTTVGLTRGSGVGSGGSAAQRAWGGTSWNSSTSDAAITAGQYATFSAAAKTGYQVSYSAVSHFDYRHSSTGPVSGLLQYQIGTGAFADIASLSYPNSTSSGAALAPLPISLSGIAALQNVGPGINVTFRIVNYGGTSSAGTWYIFDVANNTNFDFTVQGLVTPFAADLALSLQQAGFFTQGDPNDAYILTVTNMGQTATAGMVNVSASLPPGLAAVAISGDGWTTDLGSLTASRSDALPPGAVYPPLTINVQVAADAPGIVTTAANVSGGGEVVTENDFATGQTAIAALTPLQAWRLTWFNTTADAGAAADTAITAGDGLPNLLKYALGLNPLEPAVDPVSGGIVNGHLSLTVPRNPAATDVGFFIEVTGNIATGWTTDGTTIDQNTPSLLQAYDNTAVSDAPARFMRLRVSRP